MICSYYPHAICLNQNLIALIIEFNLYWVYSSVDLKLQDFLTNGPFVIKNFFHNDYKLKCSYYNLVRSLTNIEEIKLRYAYKSLSL